MPKKRIKSWQEIQNVTEFYQKVEEDIKEKHQFKLIKPKTPNQEKYLDCFKHDDFVVVNGKSGTGKTYLAINWACEQLLAGNIEKILYCRSIISCDNEIGPLPGPISERCAPYFLPAIDYFNEFFGKKKFQEFIREEKIEMSPIELLRGRTYHNCILILDEAQSATPKQIKLFLTRVGLKSKSLIIGDESQSDIPEHKNGLTFVLDNLYNIEEIGFVELGIEDICRHGLIGKIITVFDKRGI